MDGDIDEPTSFLDHVYSERTQRELQKCLNHLFSSGETEKYPYGENSRKDGCMVLRHGRTSISWRINESMLTIFSWCFQCAVNDLLIMNHTNFLNTNSVGSIFVHVRAYFQANLLFDQSPFVAVFVIEFPMPRRVCQWKPFWIQIWGIVQESTLGGMDF